MEERKIYEVIYQNIYGIDLIKLTEEQYNFLNWFLSEFISDIAIIKEPEIHEPPC